MRGRGGTRLLRVEVHVGEGGVARVLHGPALLLAALDARRRRQRGEDGAAERHAGGEVGRLAALEQREGLLRQHDLAPAQRRVDEDVHDAARLEPLAQGAEAAGGVRQVVEDADAVDEVVVAAQGGHVVERHVVEDGVVGLADQAGALRALAGYFERLAGEVEGIEVLCLWVEVRQVLRRDARAAASVEDFYIVTGRRVAGAKGVCMSP